MSRFFRYPPVPEDIEIYEETMEQWFRPGGTRDVFTVEAWGTDHQLHRIQARTRSGLVDEDPRHANAIYSMLERQLEQQMREKGVWGNEWSGAS